MSTNISIDNSIDAEMRRSITWQFDNAEKLTGVVFMLRDFFNASTKDLWDSFGRFADLSDPDAQNDFSLSIWGKFLRLERPDVLVNGSKTPILAEAYRRLLLARFRLLNSNASTAAYGDFLSYIFGSGVVSMEQGGMAISFTYSGDVPEEGNTVEYHLYRLFSDNPDAIFIYPAGVKDNIKGIGPILGFDGQQTIGDSSGNPATKVDMNVMNVILSNTSFSGAHTSITINIKNVYSPSHTLGTGVKPTIYIDDTPYYATETVNIASGATKTIEFIGAGDANPEIGSSLPLYGTPGGAPYLDTSFQCTVSGVSHFTAQAETITIPVGTKVYRYTTDSYGAITKYAYEVPYEIALAPGKSVSLAVYRENDSSSGTMCFVLSPTSDANSTPFLYITAEYDGNDRSFGIKSVYPIGSIAIPAGDGDFAVETMDNGSFAWKREIGVSND